MIRIRKSKTTRKKLTGPSEGKPVAENVTQITSESRDQFKGQSRDQFKAQPREQVKTHPREQSRDQYKSQSRDHFRGHPREQLKGQSRTQSKDQFRGDQGKKRRFPYQKKGSRERSDLPEPRVPYETKTPEEELEKGGFVLPGELVGTTEEFKPGEGTTVSAGDIYSTATGNVLIDRKARVVSVRPRTLTPNILKVGDIVYGKITDVRESGAMVEVAGIEGKEEREIVNVRSGDIHVSNVRDSYVKRLSDEFRPYDIVRARVLDTERIRLTTAEDSLGVVKAYCSNCKGELVLEGKKLKCPVCNMTETRKISTEYGKGIK
ncbi:exosome complex RNA-binding protein Csl4 [Methanosarcina vacuolata]|uniref:Exosome complex component Csl4 n=1 Tax=Methanosarcina vacuolata Z-761 TaxID=1434123 RepID=A0A0E3LHT6_9EURY|nr:exosome complex RNA-binding protein Csl4 [Methanosarcina vacuolata]AKB44836.1 exosome complex RNA-binding protein Csl4 [Methanosarcina vacuolata Z-761]